jgi:transposase
VILETTKYEAVEKTCECGCKNTSELPNGVKQGQQYGNQIKGLVCLLRNWAMVSSDKTHKFLSGLIGVPISTGTIDKIEREFADKVEGLYEQIKEKIKESPVIHADETTVKVGKEKYWAHVASTDRYTCYAIDEKRGKEATDKIGILEDYIGIIVHDCFSLYFKYTKAGHALCDTHILRELLGIIESPKYKEKKNENECTWAEKMMNLLIEINNTRDERISCGETSFSKNELFAYDKRYKEILAAGLLEEPVDYSKKRYKKSDARRLINRLTLRKKNVLLFMHDFSVPFSNNLVERDIRPLKGKQKVSGCFRTETGAMNFAKTYSVYSSALKNSINLFEFSIDIFSGNPINSLL